MIWFLGQIMFGFMAEVSIRVGGPTAFLAGVSNQVAILVKLIVE
jgi:hypothetical protein